MSISRFKPFTSEERKKFVNDFASYYPKELDTNSTTNNIQNSSESWGAKIFQSLGNDSWPILEKGRIVAFFKKGFPPSASNGAGSVHGGAIATVFDNLTTVAHMSYVSSESESEGGHSGVGPVLSVSVSLNCNYLKAIQIGQAVKCKCEVVKAGKKLVFLKGSIVACINEKSDSESETEEEILATCDHVKCCIRPKL